MSSMASPWKHPKTGTYYVRIAVPKDVQPLLGKTVFKESLHTKHLHEAKSVFAKRASEIYKIIQSARDKNAGKKAVLVSKDISTLADQWLLSEYEEYEQTGDYSPLLIEVPSTNTKIAATETYTAYEQVTTEALRKATTGEDHKPLGRLFAYSVNELLAKNGLYLDTDSKSYKDLLIAIAARHKKLCDVALKREHGDWDTKLPIKVSNSLVAFPDRPDRSQAPSISQVYEQYIDHTALKSPNSQKLKDYISSIKLFISHAGDISIDLVTTKHVVTFTEQLYKLPKTQAYDIKSLPMADQVKLASTRGLPVISSNTARNKYNHVQGLFSFAKKDKLIIKTNPFTEVRPPSRHSKNAHKNREFSREELFKIFSTPLYTKKDFKPFLRANYGLTLFWLPLLLYYTGARPREILQLQRRNLEIVTYTEEDTGEERRLHILFITDEDAEHGQTTKTDESYRQLPIHTDLIKLGFWEYVCRFKGKESIWPTMGGDQSIEQYRMNFAKKWKDYLAKHTNIESKAKPLYAYRHGLKSQFRDLGVDSNVHNAISGHAAGSISEKYGTVWLKTAIKAIDKYPSVPNFENIIPPSNEDCL